MFYLLSGKKEHCFLPPSLPILDIYFPIRQIINVPISTYIINKLEKGRGKINP